VGNTIAGYTAKAVMDRVVDMVRELQTAIAGLQNQAEYAPYSAWGGEPDKCTPNLPKNCEARQNNLVSSANLISIDGNIKRGAVIRMTTDGAVVLTATRVHGK